jgi:hypothetical protein
MTVAAVTAVHKNVHQRTGEQREPNKNAQDVSAMLSEQ